MIPDIYFSRKMDFIIIGRILKFCEKLALTPGTIQTKQKSKKHKFFICLMWLIVNLILIYVTLVNDFSKMNYLNVGITLFVQILLCGFFFNSMIVLNLTKTYIWNQFFEILQNCQSPIQIFFYRIEVVLILGTFVGIEIPYNYLSFKKSGIDNLPGQVLNLIHRFLITVYTFLICIIFKMLLIRYKKITKQLMQHLTYKHKLANITRKIPINFVKSVAENVTKLRKAVDIFNDLFGWILALLISISCIKIIVIFIEVIYNNADVSLEQKFYYLLQLTPDMVNKKIYTAFTFDEVSNFSVSVLKQR